MAQDVQIGATQVSLAQLNERSRDIFRQIVESYLATGEPVGSRNISRLITTPLSPASVRNVMSDLEQLRAGLRAAHLRRPAPQRVGAALLRRRAHGDWRSRRGRPARHRGQGRVAGRSMEAVPSEASGMLSGLTRTAGVVLTAKSNARFKHIEFVRLEPERALVVLVAEDGQIENRIVAIPPGLPSSSLTEALATSSTHIPAAGTCRTPRSNWRRRWRRSPGGTRPAHPENRRRRLRQLVRRRRR